MVLNRVLDIVRLTLHHHAHNFTPAWKQCGSDVAGDCFFSYSINERGAAALRTSPRCPRSLQQRRQFSYGIVRCYRDSSGPWDLWLDSRWNSEVEVSITGPTAPDSYRATFPLRASGNLFDASDRKRSQPALPKRRGVTKCLAERANQQNQQSALIARDSLDRLLWLPATS
jgi:hypothetical protein